MQSLLQGHKEVLYVCVCVCIYICICVCVYYCCFIDGNGVPQINSGKGPSEKFILRGETKKEMFFSLNRNKGDKIRLDWWYGPKQIHCCELIVICPHTFQVSLAQLHVVYLISCNWTSLWWHVPAHGIS